MTCCEAKVDNHSQITALSTSFYQEKKNTLMFDLGVLGGSTFVEFKVSSWKVSLKAGDFKRVDLSLAFHLSIP